MFSLASSHRLDGLGIDSLLATPSFSEVSLKLLSSEDFCVFELVDVGEAIPFDIIVEIIEIFDDAVAPSGFDVSTCGFYEEGAAGAFELFFGSTGAAGVGEVHDYA